MSQTPYATWPTGVKPEPEQYSSNAQTSSRRSGTTDASFAYAGGFPQADAQRRLQSSRSGMRPHSSSTSSLSGAMGDTHIAAHSRTSVTPPSGLASWTPSPTSSAMSSNYMTVPDDPNMAYLGQVNSASPSGAFASFSQYGMGIYASPETSPGLVSGFPDQYAFSQDRGQQNTTPPSGAAAMVISPSSTPAPGMQAARQSRASPEKLEEENRRLLQRIRQLEIVNESSRRRIRELETEVSRGAYAGGLPTPMSTPQPHGTFNQEWQARTSARIRTYCSLNRAGNALCAWHDSRRERREFPPRMAPPGFLNCGCTYEQALFEESLSRHGVGSYHPGESVRMDPALRNPLLQLLQARYGYQDGDFERDRVTGNWVEGEGAEKWEQKAASGGTYSRRTRTESERRST